MLSMALDWACLEKKAKKRVSCFLAVGPIGGRVFEAPRPKEYRASSPSHGPDRKWGQKWFDLATFTLSI